MSSTFPGAKTPSDTSDDSTRKRAEPTRLHAHGSTPSDPRCERCGSRVSPEIARVVGNNDGRVPRCRRCTDGISRTTRAATNTAGRGNGLRVAPEGRR